MGDQPTDVRTPLAAAPNARVELGHDGVLHVLAGPITLHVDRAMCEELTLTLARAMSRLQDMDARRAPPLRLLSGGRADSEIRSPLAPGPSK